MRQERPPRGNQSFPGLGTVAGSYRPRTGRIGRATRIAVLTVLAGLSGCAAPETRPGPPDLSRVAPASLVEPLVLGADVSGGAGLRDSLADVLEAGVRCPCHVHDRTHQGLFMNPETTGRRLVDEATRLAPTVVVAPDFLFWFVHRHDTPAARRGALTQGLFLLETLPCPVFVGNLPAVPPGTSAPNHGSFPVVHPIPEPERLDLNRRIATWAHRKDTRHVLPLTDWYETFRAGQPFQLGARTFHFPASHWIQPDGRRLTENGLIALGLFCLESLAGGLPDLRSGDDLEADLVLDYRELADRFLRRRDAGATRSIFTSRQAALQEIETRMVTVPAQSFVMGSEGVGPRHRVSLGSFRISATEVTQAQWEAVMAGWEKTVSLTLDPHTGRAVENRATNPSLNQGRADLPVENVTWNDCQEFLRRLNDMSGLLGADRYRLPTEAEWECACRAGTSTRFHFGPDPQHLGEYAWFAGNTVRTQPVGQLQPNAWRLYDMSGNVAEWCEDIFGPYPDQATRDPRGPGKGSSRVVRGGSIRRSRALDDVPGAWACQSAVRQERAPDESGDWLGFRVVRPVR